MSRLRTAMLSMLLIASAVIPATAVAETCANARAVDGDTIRCANGRKIRLKDVYAPELNQPGGRAAKERLGSAVNGKTFKAVFQEENFFSFLTAIGGGKITLFTDAKGNIYGPDIAGNDSMVSARERACTKF